MNAPFGIAARGTEGSNDGWLVVIAAGVAAGLFAVTRQRRIAGLWAILGGAAGVGITIYDRGNITDPDKHIAVYFSSGAPPHAGWGLYLALIASISLGLSGVVWLLTSDAAADEPVSHTAS